MQYNADTIRFIELFSSFTKVSKGTLIEHLLKYSINTLFEHPTALTTNATQLEKIDQLKEMRNLYSNLSQFKTNYNISSPSLANDYFVNYFKDYKDKEYFACAFLDTKNNVMETKILATGTVDSAAVHTRELIKEALLMDCKSIIISHNHPSGDPTPSQPDIQLTRKISEALDLVDLKLLDHIIVGDNSRFVSLKEKGILNETPALYESSSTISDIARSEIKALYKYAGSNYETDPSKENLAAFNSTKELLDKTIKPYSPKDVPTIKNL